MRRPNALEYRYPWYLEIKDWYEVLAYIEDLDIRNKALETELQKRKI